MNRTELLTLSGYTEEDLIVVDDALSLVKGHGAMLSFVHNQTEDICISAVKHDGMALAYVKNKTDAIINAALKENPDSLQFLTASEQTEPRCLLAVNLDGSSLRYVHNKTVVVCDAAVTNKASAIAVQQPGTYVLQEHDVKYLKSLEFAVR